MRGHILLVHEVLEGYVTVFLELDVVLEGLLNQVINLLLESEELRGELNRILEECLIPYDLLSADLNVGLHLLNDVFKSGVDALEYTVHQGQLI